LDCLSADEALTLAGPLVDQFYTLQFKLGGVLSKITGASRRPELTMEVDCPPVPVEVERLVQAYLAVVGDPLVESWEDLQVLWEEQAGARG
jgi:hypothetical protein